VSDHENVGDGEYPFPHPPASQMARRHVSENQSPSAVESEGESEGESEKIAGRETKSGRGSDRGKRVR